MLRYQSVSQHLFFIFYFYFLFFKEPVAPSTTLADKRRSHYVLNDDIKTEYKWPDTHSAYLNIKNIYNGEDRVYLMDIVVLHVVTTTNGLADTLTMRPVGVQDLMKSIYF